MASQTTHFDHIAAFVDDSDAANAALEAGDALRALSGGRLSVVHVIPSPAFLLSLAASARRRRRSTTTQIEHEAAQMWLDELVRDRRGRRGRPAGGPPAPRRPASGRAEAEVDVMVATRHRGRGRADPARQLRGAPERTTRPCAVLLTHPAEDAT